MSTYFCRQQKSFITYRSCVHLDNKHSVFGKIVGGLDVLTKMEDKATDKHDKPIDPIVIEDTLVFVDPYVEVDEEIKQERELEKHKPAEKKTDKKIEDPNIKAKKLDLKVQRPGVGKYISNVVFDSVKRTKLDEDDEEVEDKLKKQKLQATKTAASYNFGEFSSW